MATTEKDLFGWYPMEKMYNDNNRPSKTELEDMKELENNWMKKWESVKEKTVCPVDPVSYTHLDRQ